MSQGPIFVKESRVLIILNDSCSDLFGISKESIETCVTVQKQLSASFNADLDKVCMSLKQLLPSEVSMHRNVSSFDLLHLSAEFVSSQRDRSCAMIVIVEGLGKLERDTLFILCSDKKWVSIQDLARRLSACHGSAIVVVHTIEADVGEEKAMSAIVQPSVEVQDFCNLDNAILFWDICNFCSSLCCEEGSVIMQMVANQLQTRAEHSSIQEMLLCSKDIVDWYINTMGDSLKSDLVGELRVPCSRLIDGLSPHIIESQLRVAQPAFAPIGNTLIDNHGALVFSSQWQTCSIHTHEVKVTITSRTEGAEIYFTLDDSNPSNFSKRYRKPILLSHEGVGHRVFVIKAIALKEGMQPSRIGISPQYRVQAQTQPVKFNELRCGDEVLLSMCSATPDARILFESGEGELTGNSAVYCDPIRLHTKLVRAFARAEGMTDSIVTTYELKAQAEVPKILGTGEVRLSSELDQCRREVFLDQVCVEMQCSNAGMDGCRCYYHIQTESMARGCGPPRQQGDASAYGRCTTRYLGPVVLKGVGLHRVTAYAMANGAADSDLAEAVFEVQQQVAAVTVVPASGSFKLAVQITAHSGTAGSGILVDARHVLTKPAHGAVAAGGSAGAAPPAGQAPAADDASASSVAAAAACMAASSTDDGLPGAALASMQSGGAIRRRGLIVHAPGRLQVTLDRRDDALFAADGLFAGESATPLQVDAASRVRTCSCPAFLPHLDPPPTTPQGCVARRR